MRLTDMVREYGGWPVDVERVASLLEAADKVLTARGGRECREELTATDISDLAVEAGRLRRGKR